MPKVAKAASQATGYFLIKGEGSSRIEKGIELKLDIDDLAGKPNGTTLWDGVRNYEARNILKEMKTGDRLLYYHSSCKVPGIAGEAVVTQEATPDETQFDPKHPYYDAKATRETPRWVQVQVKFVAKFPTYVSLEELREIHRQSGGPLAEMDLFRRSRLSVQRVRQSEFEYIRTLANRS